LIEKSTLLSLFSFVIRLNLEMRSEID